MATMQSLGKYQRIRELDKGAPGKVNPPADPFAIPKATVKPAGLGAAINKVADRTVITNVGSPAYMSPELVAGTVQASNLTDIYALGVVMYYLLTGKLPFSGANTMSVIYQIVNTDPTPPSAVREGLLPEFDAIVMRAIAKDPANRFQTWDEFGAALAQLWKQEAKAEEKRDETESERFQVLRNRRSSPSSPRTTCGK